MAPMTDVLDDVYERFRHLDPVLSDPEWCNAGGGAPIYSIAGELWRAIKQARDEQHLVKVEGSP